MQVHTEYHRDHHFSRQSLAVVPPLLCNPAMSEAFPLHTSHLVSVTPGKGDAVMLNDFPSITSIGFYEATIYRGGPAPSFPSTISIKVTTK